MKTRRHWVEVVRRVATVLGCVGGGFILARVISEIVGLDGTALRVTVVVLGVIGALVGWSEAKELRPMDSGERRDAYLGWGFVGALVFVIAVIALIFA